MTIWNWEHLTYTRSLLTSGVKIIKILRECRTLVHEIKHIIEDVPTTSYYIGINCQEHEFENDNEMFRVLENII